MFTRIQIYTCLSFFFLSVIEFMYDHRKNPLPNTQPPVKKKSVNDT